MKKYLLCTTVQNTNRAIRMEKTRLKETRENKIQWKKWGPYLSERQWGTVREDYSENGDAWNFFTHDHARSRAYRFSTVTMAQGLEPVTKQVGLDLLPS